MVSDGDLEGIVAEFGILTEERGFNSKEQVELLRCAISRYESKKHEKMVAQFSLAGLNLQECIAKEAGIFVYGKQSGENRDYHVLASKSVTELVSKLNGNIIPLNPYVGVGCLADAEMIRFIDNDRVWTTEKKYKSVFLQDLVENGDKSTPSFVHYSVHPHQRDAHGRSGPVVWSIIGRKKLCSDIVEFASSNPQNAFTFFNALFKEPQFTYSQTGKLWIIDGNKISADEEGRRKTESLSESRSFMTKITYPVPHP